MVLNEFRSKFGRHFADDQVIMDLIFLLGKMLDELEIGIGKQVEMRIDLLEENFDMIGRDLEELLV